MLALAVAAALAPNVFADSGTWTNTAGGVWSEPTNWSGSIVADGAGFTAFFDTLDLTAPTTVTLDSARTIGTLSFADAVSTSAGSWTLSDGGNAANVLTLSGTPTIQVVTGVTANVALALGGTEGLTKTNGGTLILSGANTLSGNVGVSTGTLSLTGSVNAAALNVSSQAAGSVQAVFSVDGGALTSSALSTINAGAVSGAFILNSGTASFTGGLRTSNADGAVIRVNGGTLNVNDIFVQRNGGTANSLGVFTSGLMFMGGTVNAGTIRLGTNNSNGAMTIEGANVTATGNIILGNQTSGDRGGHMRILSGTFTSTDTVNGLVFVQRNGTSAANQQSNASFTGGVSTIEKISWGFDANAIGRGRLNVNGGELYIGSGGMVQNSATVVPTITLSSGTLGAKDSWSSNLPVVLGTGGNITIKAADAANVAHDINLSGVISGSGNINKTGGGTLTLSGANTYSGSVTVAAGTLAGTTSGLRGNIANSGVVNFDQSTSGTFTGVISGSGAVTKTGAGTAILANPQTYTGATTVSGGFLGINGTQATSGITVANGGGLALAGDATVNALTFGATAGDAMTLRVNTGSGVNSLGVLTTDALIAHGTTTIDVGSVGLSAGLYTVLDYAGTIGGTGGGFGAFTLGSLPARVTGNLVDNTTNTSIDLNITSVDFPRWTGAVNGNWDIGTADLSTGTQNWKEATSGNNTVYLQGSIPGDQVLFDHMATGTTSINIVAPVSPALVTVNNTPATNYTFSGAAISGPTQLIKQGTGTLTLSNSGNDYAGGTLVQDGTLQLGAANALPVAGTVTLSGGTLNLGGLSQDMSGPLVLDGGTVTNGTVNKSGANYDLRSGTVSTNLAGAVGITKTTAGTVVVIGNSSYTGPTVVNEGTLQYGDGTTLGTPVGNITNNATVAFNNNADQLYGGSIIGFGGTVVKNGTGRLTLTGVSNTSGNEGNAIVNAGTVELFGALDPGVNFHARLGRGGAITINSGATVLLQAANALGLNSGLNPASFVLNTGGTLKGDFASSTAIYDGTFAGGTLTGEADALFAFRGDFTATAGTTSTVNVTAAEMFNAVGFNTDAGATVNILTNLTGGTGLGKDGPGTVNLSGTNSYTGGTTVTAGTLSVTASAIPAANAVVVNGGEYAMAGAGPVFTPASLTVNAGQASVASGGDKTLQTPALTIAAGGILNLNDNDLIVDYDPAGPSPEGTIRQWVRDGRNAALTSGIKTTPGSPADDKVLAIVDNSNAPTPWNKTSFNGINIDASTIVGKYTYFGDSNLDGQVTGDDYLAVDSNLGVGDSWIEGDFNLDNSVTGDDYLAIDTNLGKGTTNPLAYAELKAEMVALHAAMFGDEYLVKLAEVEANGFTTVPEPGTLGLIGVAAIGMLGRRRRRA